MWLKAFFEEAPESSRIAGVRINGGHGGFPYGQMIRVRTAHRPVENAPGDMGDDQLGLVLADHAHDVVPELEVGCQVPILVAEELDLLDPQHPSRSLLLLLPDRHQLGVFLLWVLATL